MTKLKITVIALVLSSFDIIYLDFVTGGKNYPINSNKHALKLKIIAVTIEIKTKFK
jgi:hypothetical protein